MTTVRLARWGNSLAVRVPSHVLRELNLKEDDELTIEAFDDRITLKKVKRRGYNFEELVSQITPDNMHGDVWGEWEREAQGRDKPEY